MNVTKTKREKAARLIIVPPKRFASGMTGRL
jgi:hypothetical protein